MEHSKNWKALQATLRAGKSTGPPTTPITTNTTVATKTAYPVKADELWFEVDEKDLKRSQLEGTAKPLSLLEMFPKPLNANSNNNNNTAKATANRYVAMDCEYVGVGPEGKDSALARVTLVNWHGEVLLDVHVRPKQHITDYRTAVSGIRPEDLHQAIDHDAALLAIQQHLTMDTVLVGHGLQNDQRVMMYHHPRRLIRDTSKYRPFRSISRGKTPALKRLVKHFLGVDIQHGEHDSVEDARAAMLLYQSVKAEWENYLFRQEGKTVKAAQRQKRQQQSVK